MNKKYITALALLTMLIPASANAALKTEALISKPTVAILDTALDTSIPELQGRIAYEVCILDFNSCPNGKNFMEGPGSAGLPSNIISVNGFDHGTQMSSVFANNNANANIVFVRIVGNTPNGVRQTTNESTFVNALKWVIDNKDRFNIQAVSMSQGHHNLIPGANYCPNTVNTISKITELALRDTPVFLPAGNGRDLKRIDWPACIDASVSVGASTDYDQIPIWSNVDVNKTDIYALGQTSVTLPGGKKTNAIGTSIAVQVAAAKWMTVKNVKPTLTSQEILTIIKDKSKVIRGIGGTYGRLIDLEAVLNAK